MRHQEITYAVGDVHGRADLLAAVIGYCRDDAAKSGASARFVFLGDICDRGPRSRDAFEAVCSELGDNARSVLLRGNHDDWFYKAMTGAEPRVVAGWLARGGAATLESYLPGDLNGAVDIVSTLHSGHLSVIAKSRPSLCDGGILYAHAGIDPTRPATMQEQRDLMWIRDPFLGHVGPLGFAVIHGHSVVGDRPVVTENRVSLDTGACESGRLSVAAICPSERSVRFFQTDGSARRVIEIEPLRLDRGMGTLLDDLEWTAVARDQRLVA